MLVCHRRLLELHTERITLAADYSLEDLVGSGSPPATSVAGVGGLKLA